MNAQAQATASAFVRKARELAPRLRERAAATEKLRRMPDETIDDLKQAGLFKALQPRRWGGHELPPEVFNEAAMEIAAACGSTGWVYSVLAVHAWQLALFPDEAQDEVWGDDPTTLVSSSYGPTGKSEAVDGGFRLSGTWKFSSGSQSAQWVFLGGLVFEGEMPVFHTFLVPRKDYRIDDVWHTVGLAGTGSNNIVLDDVFVPTHRAHRMLESVGGPGSERNDGPTYKLPFASVFSYSITCPALGIAQGALDSHCEMMRERVRISYGGERAAEDPFSQVRVAEAAADIDSARGQMRRNFEEMAAHVARDEEIPMELRLRVRRDQVRGTALAIRATSRVFENSGAHALFDDNPIQRAWRDVHAARVHAINDPERAAKMFGAAQFGLDVPPGGMV